MKKINIEIILGLFIVVISALIFFNLFTKFNENKEKNISFLLNSNFNNVGNLVVGNDVKINGVKVGEVFNISLDYEDFIANVVLQFYKKYNIPIDSKFQISSDGLIGGSYINIITGSSQIIFDENETTNNNIDAISLENIISDIIFTN
ncbi:MAG: MlaD family protein [Proteobacteria bacterium]|nr:MlaD family protein [Pseudomonadota bacterium]